jgi:hypothetical protein
MSISGRGGRYGAGMGVGHSANQLMTAYYTCLKQDRRERGGLPMSRESLLKHDGPLQAETPVSVGEQLGSYRIEQKIGHGGMSTVYRQRVERGHRGSRRSNRRYDAASPRMGRRRCGPRRVIFWWSRRALPDPGSARPRRGRRRPCSRKAAWSIRGVKCHSDRRPPCRREWSAHR